MFMVHFSIFFFSGKLTEIKVLKFHMFEFRLMFPFNVFDLLRLLPFHMTLYAVPDASPLTRNVLFVIARVQFIDPLHTGSD